MKIKWYAPYPFIIIVQTTVNFISKTEIERRHREREREIEEIERKNVCPRGKQAGEGWDIGGRKDLMGKRWHTF